MQDGLVYAPNHLSHTSVIRRFRMVSLLMIVWIPEKAVSVIMTAARFWPEMAEVKSWCSNF